MQALVLDITELGRRTAAAKESSNQAIADIEDCLDLFGDPLDSADCDHIEPGASQRDVDSLGNTTDRSYHLKTCIRKDERFVFDEIATAMSQAAGTRVTVNNIFRAAMIVLLDGRHRLIEEARKGQLRRPQNQDSKALEEFEQAIAAMIARVVADSELAQK